MIISNKINNKLNLNIILRNYFYKKQKFLKNIFFQYIFHINNIIIFQNSYTNIKFFS